VKLFIFFFFFFFFRQGLTKGEDNRPLDSQYILYHTVSAIIQTSLSMANMNDISYTPLLYNGLLLSDLLNYYRRRNNYTNTHTELVLSLLVII